MQRILRTTTTPKMPAMRFGTVPLSTAEKKFRHEMNQEMMALLRSLPESKHTDAAVFLMEHFKTPFFPAFDYFQNYFAPSWSILYWLERWRPDRSPPLRRVRRHALGAHAMALFLHPLDDHLHDGQLPASHLSLLLRSQAWLRMKAALEPLAAVVPDGGGIVKALIDEYYAGIDAPPPAATLDGYCAHFRKQMATWMIVPTLLSAAMTRDKTFCRTVRSAYGAFGTAWRLMDDLQDMDTDVENGCLSAVCYMLPPPIRKIWKRPSDRGAPDRVHAIRDAIDQEGIVEALQGRIVRELTSSAAALASHRLEGLAHEMQCLAAPFVEGRSLP